MPTIGWAQGKREVQCFWPKIVELIGQGYNLRQIHDDLVNTGQFSAKYVTLRKWVNKLAKSYSQSPQSNQSFPPFAVERGSSAAPAPLSPTSLPSSSGSLSSAEQVRSAPVDGFRRSHTVPEDLL